MLHSPIRPFAIVIAASLMFAGLQGRDALAQLASPEDSLGPLFGSSAGDVLQTSLLPDVANKLKALFQKLNPANSCPKKANFTITTTRCGGIAEQVAAHRTSVAAARQSRVSRQ